MSQSRYREVTVSAVVFGVIAGAIMNASITYAGLKIGFTIGGSAIAAVLGFGVLRGVLRRGSILETNIAQTVASAVNTPNSGIIFTIPVLVLLGYELSAATVSFWLIAAACVAGSILGCAFIIPLRKQMLEIDRLRFPSGTAVAVILKSPGAGAKKSLVLVAGAVLGALVYLPVGLPGLTVPAQREDLDTLVARERILPADAERTREIMGWIEAGRIPDGVVDKGREEARRVAEGEVPEARADGLALAAFRVASGLKEWQALDPFLARKPLFWGYSDLDLRFRAPPPPDPGDPADAARYQRAMRHVDHTGSGMPNLVVTDGRVDVGRLLGLPSFILFVFAITPLSFGAGYITGRAGLLVLAGGVLAYLFLSPAAYVMGWMPATTAAHAAPRYGWTAFNRPLGIGMLLGGALMGVLFALPAMKSALKSILSATREGSGCNELGMRPLLIAIALCAVVLFLAANFMPAGQGAGGGWLGGLGPTVKNLVIMAVGLVWIWFAGVIIAQCTGMTDWSPISGMALITVILMLKMGGDGNVLGAVLIGATLCVSVTCAADMMHDLKTGFLVGAIPRRQQIVELVTTGLGPMIAMGTILLIVATTPLGTASMPAPQAVALEAVITGVQGAEMPYMLYGGGALLGIALGLGAFPGLGVLVGLSMYLPIEYVLPYGLGCLANMLVRRVKGAGWAEEWGVPLCAGLIVGEAVLQLVINVIKLLMG